MYGGNNNQAGTRTLPAELSKFTGLRPVSIFTPLFCKLLPLRGRRPVDVLIVPAWLLFPPEITNKEDFLKRKERQITGQNH